MCFKEQSFAIIYFFSFLYFWNMGNFFLALDRTITRLDDSRMLTILTVNFLHDLVHSKQSST